MTAPRRALLVAALVAFVLGAVLVGIGLSRLIGSNDGGGSAPAPGALDSVIAAGRPAASPFAGLTEVQLGLDARCLRLVVADSLEERVQGLRGRLALRPYGGMLFAYPGPSSSAFTMADTVVALDIGFYDERGRPVDRLKMTPCRRPEPECPLYRSQRHYRYALETLRGELPSGGLAPCGG